MTRKVDRPDKPGDDGLVWVGRSFVQRLNPFQRPVRDLLPARFADQPMAHAVEILVGRAAAIERGDARHRDGMEEA